MNRWSWVAAGLVTAGAAGAGALSHSGRSPAGPVLRTDNSFQFTVRAPRRTAFPLFGAWGEKAWGGDSWQPRFLYPDPPRDEPGEVFTVAHGHHDAVWVNTAFDEQAGRVQYVYVLADVQAVLIDLQLDESAGGESTQVRVRYRRTALRPEMNERVRQLGAQDAASGPEWAAAVNAALETPANRLR